MASDRMTQKVKVNIENKNFFLNIEKVTQQIKYAFTKAQAFIKKKNYFDCPLWFQCEEFLLLCINGPPYPFLFGHL